MKPAETKEDAQPEKREEPKEDAQPERPEENAQPAGTEERTAGEPETKEEN